MPESNNARRYANATQNWRDFIERRSSYFVELHTSGRWKHYYTEQDFRLRLREVAQLVELWTELAPRPQDGGALRGAAAVPDRTAA